MKLYATTTSERASKGQGGNKFIRIQLTAGDAVNQVDMGMIEMLYMDLKGSLNTSDCVEIRYFKPKESGYHVIYDKEIPKGKKKKDECDGKHDTCEDIVKCPDCSKALDRM